VTPVDDSRSARNVARGCLPLALYLLLCWPGASAARDLPVTIEQRELVRVEARLIVSGPRGSVEAGLERLDVPAGETGLLERKVDLALAGGASVPLGVTLSVSGSLVDEDHIELAVDAEVRPEQGPSLVRRRRGTIADGRSLLVEIYGTDTDPLRRLFVMVSAERDVVPIVHRMESDTRPVDLILDVTHVEGERRRLLEQVRLSTLSGRPVDYAFRLVLPAELLGMDPGQGLQEVAVIVRILPRQLPDGKLDLTLTLLNPGGRPWTDGEPLKRSVTRRVELGESVSLRLTSRAGGLTYLFSVASYF
jgi:hypothetical protein